MITSCQGCGACCQYVGTPPFAKGETTLTVEQGEMGSPCTWYNADQKNCKHYHLRPAVCREYEMGGQECIDLRIRSKIDVS